MRALVLSLMFIAPLALAEAGREFRDCDVCPRMIEIPAGSFVMGVPENGNGSDKEKPQRTVSIAAFSIGKYEVTQAEWVAIMGSNPSENGGDDSPVDHVSWEMAQQFVKKLSERTGKSYRLPSEAEWEYAARAGTTTDYLSGEGASGMADFAWFRTNAEMQAHPVGKKKPNAFGLYDIFGNVSEWTQDCWNPNHAGAPTTQAPREQGECESRVMRGGSWFNVYLNLRSGFRLRFDAALQSSSFGMRVARSR